MKVLELFSGTGSVGKVCRERGHHVTSLDRDMPADIQTDIMLWDYTAHPPWDFDFVWASPPCTEYSAAKTMGARKISEANEVVKRTIEIIRYFDPKFWVLENPQTGLLKAQAFMHDLPYCDVDYCKYGMPYRKRTRLWNNILVWEPRPLCARDCGSMTEDGRRHKETAQRLPSGPRAEWGDAARHSQHDPYRIPVPLVLEILTAVEQYI